MPGLSVKNFNLPWHQHDQYWIAVYPHGSGSLATPIVKCLQEAGLQKIADEGMGLRTDHDWKSAWDRVSGGLKALDALAAVEVVLAPDGESIPRRADSDCKAPVVIQLIADSLWLGDALMDDRVMCFLQPVMSNQDKVFGYESFVRVREKDGTIIGGDRIIAASRVLGIEYMIDRLLHVQAIKTFVSSEFNGFLFVNLFPGFIHRPSVYLEGLSETVKNYGVVAKHIVLDFTNSEMPYDIAHLRSVCEYARSRGYSIALDDVVSVDNTRKLVSEIRPDFVKIDMQLTRKVMEMGKRETIHTIVQLTHDLAGSVVAEGVETPEIHQALKTLGVDLYQGYLFSPPVPVEAALKRTTAS